MSLHYKGPTHNFRAFYSACHMIMQVVKNITLVSRKRTGILFSFCTGTLCVLLAGPASKRGEPVHPEPGLAFPSYKYAYTIVSHRRLNLSEYSFK